MNEELTIYSVLDNNIFSLKVRETKKRYIAIEKPSCAFGFRTNFYKDECSTSKLEAVIKSIRREEYLVEKLEEKLNVLKHNLTKLHTLKEKLRG